MSGLRSLHLHLDDDQLEWIAHRVADLLRQTGRARPGSSEPEQRWLTVQQAAIYIGAKPQRVYDLRSAGRLSRHGDGARALIDRNELDRLIEEAS